MIKLKNGFPVLTESFLAILNTVNRTINQRVHYKTDAALYEKADFWTIAQTEGDCEDYSLAKKKALIEAGVPKEFIRICTAWVEGPNGEVGKGGYHAILAVDTDGGTLILDNRYKDLHYWEDMPYKWHLREIPGKFIWEKIH